MSAISAGPAVAVRSGSVGTPTRRRSTGVGGGRSSRQERRQCRGLCIGKRALMHGALRAPLTAMSEAPQRWSRVACELSLVVVVRMVCFAPPGGRRSRWGARYRQTSHRLRALTCGIPQEARATERKAAYGGRAPGQLTPGTRFVRLMTGSNAEGAQLPPRPPYVILLGTYMASFAAMTTSGSGQPTT
jgi:hypothetical protein